MRFTSPDAALAAACRMQAGAFPVALALCGETVERFSAVSVAETSLPATGHKLRTRTSQLSDRQWAKVVERSLEAVGGASGWPVSVSLIAGEPFDHRDVADELPAGYPKSTLKGVAPGPVAISATLFADGPNVVEISLSPGGREVLSEVDQWELALIAIEPLTADPAFEVAAVRASSSGLTGSVSPDDADESVIIVCGPATNDARRAELESSATSRIGTDPIVGLVFDRR